MATAFRLDGLSSSHPIKVDVNHPNEINEIFDSISYNKVCVMTSLCGAAKLNNDVTSCWSLSGDVVTSCFNVANSFVNDVTHLVITSLPSHVECQYCNHGDGIHSDDDSLVFPQGSCILRMLESILGNTTFVSGLTVSRREVCDVERRHVISIAWPLCRLRDSMWIKPLPASSSDAKTPQFGDATVGLHDWCSCCVTI